MGLWLEVSHAWRPLAWWPLAWWPLTHGGLAHGGLSHGGLREFKSPYSLIKSRTVCSTGLSAIRSSSALIAVGNLYIFGSTQKSSTITYPQRSFIMNQTARKALELIPSRTGRPRLNKSSRILARFYEPLFLLRALGQRRGVHTRRPRDTDKNTEIRWKFLENLCLVCDFMKGGMSCTAIGLEERSYTYKFWLASNGRHSDIAIFLKNALKLLCCASSLNGIELDTTK